MKTIFTLFTLLFFKSYSQQIQLIQLPDMPAAISNNAISFGENLSGETCIYSFGGIDSTKNYAGISKAVFRFNTITNLWTVLDSIPSLNANIAMGASSVKNKIYLVGGYTVFSSGNEASTDKLYIFDPLTEQFTTGAPIPVPIDDHVQAVWKDSLIFIITGWSNTTNVPNVQIYNPSFNVWSVGTSLPNTNQYKAFGACGTIIGDTIYYLGGASTNSNFPCQNLLRKGYIDPVNPTQISWSIQGNLKNIYRGVSFSDQNQNIYFAGGSSITYNYDGIAYNGSGPVNQANRVQFVQTANPSNVIYDSIVFPMDLRGIAEVSSGVKYLAGGMENDQKVSKKAYRIEVSTTLNSPEKLKEFRLNNPVSALVDLSFLSVTDKPSLYSSNGQKIVFAIQNGFWNTQELAPGTYYLKGNGYETKMIIKY